MNTKPNQQHALAITLAIVTVAFTGPATQGEDKNTSNPSELWSHLSSTKQLADVRGMSAMIDDSGDHRVLRLGIPNLNLPLGESVHDSRRGIAWVSVPPPADGWKLDRVANVQASVKNIGSKQALVTLWVVSPNGWSAVGGSANIPPQQATTLSCNLRETYPDKTAKIDPTRVTEIRIMVQRTAHATLEVSNLIATATADDWVRPAGRIDVPDMVVGKAAPGKRVRYQLPADSDTDIYSALYLPPGWEPGKRYPVIVEYPGNIFFTSRACWSTGRPEQCVMGYGITLGKDAIWVSLPFVDRPAGEIAESGFGSNVGEDTTRYALSTIEDICTNWGGDPDNLFLCGFSRGAIACGYIGLRNEEIAKLWKGFVACQHYDGSRWRESRMEDAVKRAPRFAGRAIFQVDNSQQKYQPVADATDASVEWTWTQSGLGYHATAMFLDDRPLMKQLRAWYQALVAER